MSIYKIHSVGVILSRQPEACKNNALILDILNSDFIWIYLLKTAPFLSLGCRIGTCKIVNEYAKAGHVVCDGRMVLYADKSPIAWNSQGLRISVDACFGGPLLVLAGTPKDQKTAWIQTLFVSGTPVEDEGDVSEEEDVTCCHVYHYSIQS